MPKILQVQDFFYSYYCLIIQRMESGGENSFLTLFFSYFVGPEVFVHCIHLKDKTINLLQCFCKHTTMSGY